MLPYCLMPSPAADAAATLISRHASCFRRLRHYADDISLSLSFFATLLSLSPATPFSLMLMFRHYSMLSCLMPAALFPPAFELALPAFSFRFRCFAIS